MSNTYESDNTRDNEQKKFQPDSDGNTAVNVLIAPGSSIGFSPFGPLIVSASSSLVIDTNLLSTFSRLDYIINFKDSPVTVTKSLKLVIQNDAGLLTDMVSERMGGAIDVDVIVTDDAVDAFVTIDNNEIFDVTITFLRALLP